MTKNKKNRKIKIMTEMSYNYKYTKVPIKYNYFNIKQ